MKKISLILVGFIASGNIVSANVLSISAGVGYEQQKIDGYVKNGNTINYFNNKSAENDGNPNTGNLGLKDKNNPFFWLKIIHSIPILPNIKFQYTKYHSTGHSNYIAGNVKIFNDTTNNYTTDNAENFDNTTNYTTDNVKILDNITIPIALTDADTKMDIDSYDITLFYEFNPIFANIEVGAGADIWSGNTKIYDNITDKEIVNQNFTIILPYVYGHIETMQLFGFSALATVKWAKAGDNHHYDYLGTLKYTIDIPGSVNPFIKVGYRYKEAYGVDGDNTTKLQYKGVFLEIGAKF